MTTRQPKTQLNLGAVRYGYRPTQTLRRRRIKRTVFAVVVALSLVLIIAMSVRAQTIGEPHSECATGAACHFAFLPGVMR